MGNPEKKFRILIVDDHPLVRSALRDSLQREPDLLIAGEAEDCDQALAEVAKQPPDLLIIDLSLKNSDGIDLVRAVQHEYPRVRTIVLSMHDESVHAERVIRAGASGYISKQEAATRVVQAVRKVLKGEIYWSEKAAAQVASRIVSRIGGNGSPGAPMDVLSRREMQVFELIGAGANPTQIAQQLKVDLSTVDTYRARIKEKLRLKNAAELRREAIRWNVERSATR